MAIDIETVPIGADGSLLDPARSAVAAFGAWGHDSRNQIVQIALHASEFGTGDPGSETEKALLEAVAEVVRGLGNVEIIGWNSSGFDMPFLARRFSEHGLSRRPPP